MTSEERERQLAARSELIEKLADIEHQRWSDWQKWMHSCGYRLESETTIEGRHEGNPPVGAEMPAGSLVVSLSHVAHWDRQIETPYAELSEREKESDREQVMRYWPLIVLWVHDWLQGPEIDDQYAAEKWLEAAASKEVMGALRDLDETRF